MAEVVLSARHEPVSISMAVRAANEVIEHLLDRAVARVTGAPIGELPERIVAITASFGQSAGFSTEAERRATAIAAGVSNRPMETLESAPGLPQSLIAAGPSRSTHFARAATLAPDPVWRLAGLRSATSRAGRMRAEMLDRWLRATVLLTEGRITIEPHAPRTLWTLVHGEAAALSPLQDLAQTASRFAVDSDGIGLVESFLCLEHALRLGRVPGKIDASHPIAMLQLAGAPRYGFNTDPPPASSIPIDFRPFVLSEPSRANT